MTAPIYQTPEELQKLIPLIEQAHTQGQRIILTNGVFDLLHVSHVQLLLYAKSYGDLLIVAVDSDKSVQVLKGPTRPIISQEDRLLLVASLSMVDHVVLFTSEQLTYLIQVLRPHYHVKGGDYQGRAASSSAALEANGGKRIIGPLFGTTHTSLIIQKILRQQGIDLVLPDQKESSNATASHSL